MSRVGSDASAVGLACPTNALTVRWIHARISVRREEGRMSVELIGVDKELICSLYEQAISLNDCRECEHFIMLVTDEEGQEYVVCEYEDRKSLFREIWAERMKSTCSSKLWSRIWK